MAVFPKIVGTLEQSMQAATLRHQVIANNLANVNVPGFQASEVSFEDRLKQALDGPAASPQLQGITTDPRHIPIPAVATAPGPVLPMVVPVTNGVMRQDGNNVDPEAEMAKLAANQLWYEALVRSVSDEFNRLRTVITEGRK
ncbi:MAG: flagellar basal-body rod protein FlgB [Firmicutes bacterium]|nr:flagellar basal-body rod protein FlgB [Bacillota bacterium]